MDMEWLGWLFVLLGIVMVGLSLPLALGKVPPNWFYGFRTPKTLSSPDLWYAANRSLGRDGVVAGVATTIASTVVALAGSGRPLFVVFANLAIMLIGQAVVLARGFRTLRRL